MTVSRAVLSCITAHRKHRKIPIDQITHFMADTKFVTAYYPGGELLLDESLNALHAEFGDRLVRSHRNTLVARNAISSIWKIAGGSVYAMVVTGVDQPLQVSRAGRRAVLCARPELVGGRHE